MLLQIVLPFKILSLDIRITFWALMKVALDVLLFILQGIDTYLFLLVSSNVSIERNLLSEAKAFSPRSTFTLILRKRFVFFVFASFLLLFSP